MCLLYKLQQGKYDVYVWLLYMSTWGCNSVCIYCNYCNWVNTMCRWTLGCNNLCIYHFDCNRVNIAHRLILGCNKVCIHYIDCKRASIMHELPWIMIFGSRVRQFANNFHEWRSHEWKSSANRFTSDPKIVIQSNQCIILFLMWYFMSWIHNSAKKNHWSLIPPLPLKTVFSDLALWCNHSWSVTSHERGVLALRHHIRRLFLHAQICAKQIFTSE